MSNSRAREALRGVGTRVGGCECASSPTALSERYSVPSLRRRVELRSERREERKAIEGVRGAKRQRAANSTAPRFARRSRCRFLVPVAFSLLRRSALHKQRRARRSEATMLN